VDGSQQLLEAGAFVFDLGYGSGEGRDPLPSEFGKEIPSHDVRSLVKKR
jgi:hypothetical protein